MAKLKRFQQFQLPPNPVRLVNPEAVNHLALGTVVQPTRVIGGNLEATDLKVKVAEGSAAQVYTMTARGIFNFGDGNDGDVTISGNTTLTADKYYKNLTVNSGVTLSPAGYRVFVSVEANIFGTISRNGSAGSNGAHDTAGGAGGAGGTALADGYLKGALAGKTGGAGGTSPNGNGVAGTAGTNTTNSIGANGVAGGTGGTGVGTGGAGGAGGTATASNVELIANWHLATLLDVGSTGAPVKFDNSASAGSGGGGGAGNNTGGGGGGSGTAGGIVAIYAKKLIIHKGATVSANGAIGGNGGNSPTGTDNGGGGGGAGGNGGQVVLVYNEFANNGTLTAIAGTGGSGGTGNPTPTKDGAAGTSGAAGTIYQFKVSL